MPTQRILRLSDVQSMTGKSRSAIYSDVERGLFPAPIKLGLRAIGWRIEDVEGWLASLETARPAQATGAAR